MEIIIANPQTSFVVDRKVNSEEVPMIKRVNYHGVGQVVTSIVLVVWTVITTSFFIEGVPVRDCPLP